MKQRSIRQERICPDAESARSSSSSAILFHSTYTHAVELLVLHPCAATAARV